MEYPSLYSDSFLRLSEKVLRMSAERIVKDRVKTARSGRQLPRRVVRNPAYFIELTQKSLIFFVCASEDNAQVIKRQKKFGSVVPFLFAAKDGVIGPATAALEVPSTKNPIVLAGELGTKKSKTSLNVGTDYMFYTKADSRSAVSNINFRFEKNSIEYDVPLCISICFGSEINITSCAEELENCATHLLSIPRSENYKEFKLAFDDVG